MKIGAQLYTVYEHLQNLTDFDSSLKKVADIGYKAVQVSGSCPYDPYWLKDELQKYDLTCVLTHTDTKRILNETEKVVEEHRVFGCNRIGIGAMPYDLRSSMEGYREFKKTFLPAAMKMKEMGAKLHYHNHWFEFDKLEGKDAMQRMLEDFPEDVMDFTLDLGWAAYAGADVVKLLDQFKGRLSVVHLKDYTELAEGEEPEEGLPVHLRPIYDGKLDYDAYINALAGVGCEYMLVEQDWCYGEDPFACLKKSYDNVTKRFPSAI